jgi:hypothetical protein
METHSPEILADLRHGRGTRERKIAVCTGGAHLEPADRAEILAVLSADLDQVVSSRAQSALLFQSIDAILEALKREQAVHGLFAYAARNLADKPGIADAMAQNHNCPPEYIAPIVRHLSTSGVQVLLEELLRLSESPALAAALEHSTSITTEQRNLLRELHGPSTPQDEAALAEAVAAAEPEVTKRMSLLQQIAKMNVAERVQFAIKGGTEARRALIRDVSKVVQRAVLQSPRLTDQEVEGFAAMSTLTDEILRLIATNRNFRKNYTVTRNLLNNPKTPLDVSLHLLPAINAQDLKRLTMNKNIPETLRTSALKLQRTRADSKK